MARNSKISRQRVIRGNLMVLTVELETGAMELPISTMNRKKGVTINQQKNIINNNRNHDNLPYRLQNEQY